MILDFDSYIINESSLKKLKRQIHGALDMKSRKRMRRELRDNIVTFKFKKRNGEIRTAHGTLHPSYLPKLRGGAPRPEHQMVYYDLDKNSWRSFRSYSFIKILNVKPVSGSGTSISTKPVSKPVHKSEEEEEEVKNTTSTENEEEKEVKKPIHKEDDEEKEQEKVSKEKEEPESILDDKDTDEEKELVDKENEEDEKKKTNESISSINQYPNVNILGDGEYDGVLWGHCFVYEGHKYYSQMGWKNMYPSYCKMIIHGNDAIPKQIDIYQRKELKKLFI